MEKKGTWCVRTEILEACGIPPPAHVDTSWKASVAVRIRLGLQYLVCLLKSCPLFDGIFPDSNGDLEKGAGPLEEEVAKMLKDFISQSLAAFLPGCVMAYPVLKDAPNHVKLVISAGLVIIFIVLYAGMLARSLARRWLSFRLASCSAVTLLTFSFASQLSGPTYIALAAVAGVLLNLFIMMLRF